MKRPANAAERRHMSPSRRKRILDRDGNACRTCDSIEGPFEIDHHIPLWLGGTDDDENLRTLCFHCHGGETRRGAKNRAKINRLNGTTPKRKWRKIPSRPLPKKSDPWVQRIRAKIEARA